MTFIDLMRLLISRASLNEVEMKDAKALLDNLEQLNAFGIVLGTTSKQIHKCTPRNQYEQPRICTYCGKEM